MSRPLDGLLVVSLEQAIAAPYATRLLADAGARVIKVERPGGGDFARGYDRRARGLSSHFAWTNRSKESIALDLRETEDLALLKRMLKTADVFVQNLAPGAAERLGLGQAALRAANPRLVTCSISGYGPGGPYETRKAYDLLIQAEAGFLSLTGTPGEMAKAGISIADIAAGIAAHHNILLAVIARHRTGEGDHIEVSMLEALAEWMGFPMYFATDGAEPPSRNGAAHATIFPYGPYEASDGTVFLGLQNEREWDAFCRTVLRRDDLANDPSLRSNADRADQHERVDTAIASVFETLTAREALERLDAARIGTASVNTMAGLWAHPQLKARDRWRTVSTPTGELPAFVPPTGEAWEARMDPIPDLDEHGAALRAEFASRPGTSQDHS